MSDKKFFFFDIDGTIAVDIPRRVPESTKRTLNKLKENGHFVSIATGRMYVMTTEFCEQFGIENMVTDGGKGIVIDGNPNIEPLDHSMMLTLTKELDEKNIPWSVCIKNERKWYMKDDRFHNAMKDVIKFKNYMQTIIKEDLDIEKEKNIFKGFVFIDIETEKTIKSLENTTYTRYHSDYIIIEADDKSVGIKKIMNIMNINDKDVVVFGDNTNDIKMFRPEWTKIAMGNSVQQLKEIADFVTKDADDDGIEFACKYFGWID